MCKDTAVSLMEYLSQFREDSTSELRTGMHLLPAFANWQLVVQTF